MYHRSIEQMDNKVPLKLTKYRSIGTTSTKTSEKGSSKVLEPVIDLYDNLVTPRNFDRVLVLKHPLKDVNKNNKQGLGTCKLPNSHF